MSELIEFFDKFSTLILFVVLLGVILLIGIARTKKENQRIYEAVRNEEISRISEGVADGMLAVFSNENFLQSLRDGAVIQININVDGSQNIIISGKNNSVMR
ncbi:hypothetical protein [Campylobacter ureolyticus]|uniref:Uncharacterized protein n=1 Tax=Campylobacter ureolyticus TaxID=827 RepID=A0AAE7EAF3_9BACT|nr:hypothetical protein [Campylobacter ureolyticus]MCR8685239.1 hypothetical protein [Campylobacter ureolyticus]MCR8698817.1 hypothetical protein [Campylobacter ureolyticus]QKF84572.1 hypothetical protein CURT_1095 [Campylobacter ureolyticus]QQY35265.1 hypothetical protein I6I59_07035 [Campylobacter ureolyticus]SUX22134.1 Uncharacterised protein [Campylobacter ureolyticus]